MLGYPSGIRGADIVEAMNHLQLTRGVPNAIKVDNRPKFVSKDLGKWASDNEVELDFSRPTKPTDNAIISSFNRSFRDEWLNILGEDQSFLRCCRILKCLLKKGHSKVLMLFGSGILGLTQLETAYINNYFTYVNYFTDVLDLCK